MTSLAAVVLAGGRSSRMGHDKALISLGTETLIQRTCRVALACADAVYIVTPWCDRYRSLVAASVQCVEEQLGVSQTSEGPLVGIVQALDWLHQQPGDNPEWVLVLACDLPNLSAAVLTAWRTDLATLPSSCLAYIPQRQRRWEPLCGFYRATALEPLQQHAAGSQGRSLQGWLDQHPARPIPLANDTEAMLTNVNTPADLEAWQAASGL
ncbi:MAG: molybdenum cofactor guanylyltransferase [Nodosilinea sp.]